MLLIFDFRFSSTSWEKFTFFFCTFLFVTGYLFFTYSIELFSTSCDYILCKSASVFFCFFESYLPPLGAFCGLAAPNMLSSYFPVAGAGAPASCTAKPGAIKPTTFCWSKLGGASSLAYSRSYVIWMASSLITTFLSFPTGFPNDYWSADDSLCAS